MAKERPIDVRFIEFMPFAMNDWEKDKFISYEEIKRRIIKVHPDFAPMPVGTDAPSSTQKSYAGEKWLGRIGFISSMSDHFCGGCNRLRLTADGHLKVCLFDNRELDLKTLIELGTSDTELLDYIRAALTNKHYSHGGVDSILKGTNRPMVRIGG